MHATLFIYDLGCSWKLNCRKVAVFKVQDSKISLLKCTNGRKVLCGWTRNKVRYYSYCNRHFTLVSYSSSILLWSRYCFGWCSVQCLNLYSDTIWAKTKAASGLRLDLKIDWFRFFSKLVFYVCLVFFGLGWALHFELKLKLKAEFNPMFFLFKQFYKCLK